MPEEKVAFELRSKDSNVVKEKTNRAKDALLRYLENRSVSYEGDGDLLSLSYRGRKIAELKTEQDDERTSICLFKFNGLNNGLDVMFSFLIFPDFKEIYKNEGYNPCNPW